MKKGTIIKLNQSIFGSARINCGKLMMVTEDSETDFSFEATPYGEGWNSYQFENTYSISHNWIDKTYKHKDQ